MNTSTHISDTESKAGAEAHEPTAEISESTGSSDTDATAITPRRSVNLRTLLLGGAAAVLVLVVVIAIAVLGWQLSAKSNDLAAVRLQASNEARAEQVSLDYATGAADMNFQNPAEWSERLTAGTSPELATRLQQAATSMEQLIVPLQWTSTATPIAATVESESGGVYEVTSFVNVLTKNLQAPDGIESTATYKMSVDSANDWQITQISGIGSTAPAVSEPAAEQPPVVPQR